MTTTARMTIYPDPELKQRIEAIRVRERRSLNAQVLMLLERAVELEEQEPVALRSVAVMGDRTVDMLSGEEIDPVTLGPPRPKRKRSGPCVHRIAADQFCKICDGANG